MNIRKTTWLACLISCLLFSIPGFSQTVSKENLSTLKVDDYTDAQIRSIIAQASANNMKDEQLVQLAVSRGMSQSEILKLQERIKRVRAADLNKNKTLSLKEPIKKKTGRNYNSDDLYEQDTSGLKKTEKEEDSIYFKSRIFGADIFNNKKISFEPNLRLATPKNYQIGPDDEILIDIYGNSEISYKLLVSPEGNINVPTVGIIQVNGLTMEQATVRIKSRLSTIYTALRSGKTFVNISLGDIRTIKVTITGDVSKPGTYSLSSLANVSNALYSSGGPTDNGSFRQIEVIRGDKKVAVLDLYDFLLTGSFKNNIRLQDQDVIRIPTYSIRVEMIGEIKKPFLFELLPGETMADLIRFAGGFTERAYNARIKVLKYTGTERSIEDINKQEFDTYKPSTGDKFYVDEILERFTNRVTIGGAVFRPGEYQLEPNLTIKQLIAKAEGLREDAFKNRLSIIRLKDDLQTEIINVDIAQVLSGQKPDILLQREDMVMVSSIFGLKEYYTVQINGEVQRPGTYNYAEGMSLQDVLILSGNLKEGASPDRIEVSRRVKDSNPLSVSSAIAEVIQVDVSRDLKASASNFVLQPFDIISVRPSSGYEVQRQVNVQGEVLYPGIYTLSKKNERISEIITRAGGFTAQAYKEGASLNRTGTWNKPDSAKLNNRHSLAKDSLNNYVGINMPKIIKSPGSKEDIFLEEGDILFVPKQLQTVKVSGEVLSARTVVYSDNQGFRSYISSAGGFNEKARKGGSYVMYANGSVKGTRRFLFFNNYPAIKPGAEIFVPLKTTRKVISAGEIVGITSGLASLGAIILGVLNISK